MSFVMMMVVKFSERKGTGAVLHCNGKIPCLASLIYSGTEFKMKDQGVIKVRISKLCVVFQLFKNKLNLAVLKIFLCI